MTNALRGKTIEIVKSTAPVLATHGTAITTRFYERMFERHPELLHIFNHANQKQGRQQTALAQAVYAAAQHIDNLSVILPVVKQIGHKHRSLGVRPEHYPIVGENLLAAIKEVLGDAATDDVLDAWKEAYGLIAQIFIQVEQEMYESAEQQTGGWPGFREFVVERKVEESKVITSFYLKPADGEPLAPFVPGQYVSVKMEIATETYTHIRQYSLSHSPDKAFYRISVKREDAREETVQGIVSSYLHSQVQEGDVLLLSAPAGDFVLDQTSDKPVVLISGGVGLTPMMSMLHTLVQSQPERHVTFIHAAINGEHHALRSEVAEVTAHHPNVSSYVCYSAPTESDYTSKNFDREGFVTEEWLRSVLTTLEADFYFCGPVPFMKEVNQILKGWNIPQDRIHFEFFGPAGSLD